MATASVIREIEPIVARYLDVLRHENIRPQAVYLFGSFATGNPHKWSDIDLAIVSPDFAENTMEDQAHLMCLTWDVDVRIEPHPFRPEDFTPDNPWAAEILRTGIRIL